MIEDGRSMRAVEGKRSNRRWALSSALKFKELLWRPRWPDQRFRNGNKTFLKRLGVSNGFPVFSKYRTLRWFALSPLIPMSLGLTQSSSTKLAQALGVHLIFVFSTEALAISRWSRHQLQSVFHPAQTGSGDPSWVPVPFLVPKKRSSTLAICRGDSVTPKNSVALSPRPDFSSSGQCDRIISASVCLTGFQYSRRRKSSVVYKRNKSIVRVAP